MEVYEGGGHAYFATKPTDALTLFGDAMIETQAYAFEKLASAQCEQGNRVRAALASVTVEVLARLVWWSDL